MLRTDDQSGLEETAEATASLAVTLAWAVGALVVAYVLATVASVLIRRLGRRNPLVRDMGLRMRRPMRVVLMVVAVWIAVHLTADQREPWFDAVSHALLIATILSVAWLVGAVAFVVEGRTLARFSGEHANDRHARRVRTQVNLVRRVTVAVLVVCAIAAVLLTFPTMQAAGASILASAGLLSIVLGVAAQSSLANAFAGMQIAFTDAIRVDDVVVVLDGEFGRIEEITLTYVVVHGWDDRRLILPCTYFTTTPFENWTRRAADLLGTVEIDLDFQVPMTAVRAELDRLLAESPLWDHRTGVLQVTEAVGGAVRVRALVSAADAPTLWDLRCFVREGLVAWVQREAPEALPRTRYETGVDRPQPVGDAERDDAERGEGIKGPVVGVTTAAPGVVPSRAPMQRRDLPAPVRSTVRPARPAGSQDRTVALPVTGRDDADATVILPAVEDEVTSSAARSALFSGSADAEERSTYFQGPGQDVIDEREHTALLHLEDEDGDEDEDQDDRDGPRGEGRDDEKS